MTLPILTAGDLAITLIALVTAVYEGWLLLQRRAQRFHLWAALVALGCAAYSGAAAVQYTLTDPAQVPAVQRVEFVALLVIASALTGFAAAATGRALPVPPAVAGVLAAVALFLVVGTDLVVSTQPFFIDVWWLGHPFPQMRPAVLTGPFLAVLLLLAGVATARTAWSARERDERILHGTALAGWLAAATWDTLLSTGILPSTPVFFLEYGFCLVALSLVAVDVRRYGQLLRRTEASQAQSEESFRVLIERSPIATLVHRDGIIIYANDAAVRALGHDRREDLLGAQSSELFHPDDRAAAEERLRAVLATAQAAPPHEVRIRRRDGDWAHLDMAVVPIVFHGGPALVSMGVDVTQRRSLTAEMMRMDRMVAVGTLAAGVAHEINNPMQFVIANVDHAAAELQAVAAFLEALQGRTADAAAAAEIGEQVRQVDNLRTALSEALEGAGRVRNIVRDLRTFSRGHEDRLEPLQLAPILESSINMAFTEIRHRARLVKDLQPTPTVRANDSRLGQVFLNLLVNAAHAIPEGRAGENEVRVRTFTAPDGAAIVEVEDTGTGIPAELRDRVFDPFFTTKPPGQGTGLGLSICQGIVRELGGDIRFTTEVGQGTTFRVTLPAAPAPTAQTAALAVPAAPVTRARVLVVDDEEKVGLAVGRMLGREHDVVALTSARAALDCLRRGETFDVILCDLMMPDITGMEFHALLQEEYPALAERVVFVTGGAFTPQARDLFERTRARRLEKPFERAALRRLVQEMVA
ncbi:MAG: PAS domain S-box protein [Deltaproteobacteria bacterium]|nr:PAS domain S-box protein [Deltaproteobacteria bacterium]